MFILFNIFTSFIFPERFYDAYVSQGLLGIVFSAGDMYWYIVILSFVYLCVPLLKNSLFLLFGLATLALFCGPLHMGFAKFVVYLFYFMLGMYLYNNSKKMLSKWNFIWCVLFLFLSTFRYFVFDGVAVLDVYSKVFIALPGCLFFFMIFKQEKNQNINLFTEIGQNTLIIYLTHQWILWSIGKLEFKEVYPGITFWTALIGLVVFYKIVMEILKRYPKLKLILFQPSKILNFNEK